jgi:DMSO reductase anchor subunit
VLRPTTAPTLAFAAVATAVAAWFIMGQIYGQLPELNWLAGLTLAGLAVVEVVAARSTRARIAHRPGAGPVNPFLIARLAVLAKASSLAGAIFAGAYGGVAGWALSEHGKLTVADQTLAPSLIGVGGALTLVAAALLLERACRVPPSDEHDQDTGEGGPANRH